MLKFAKRFLSNKVIHDINQRNKFVHISSLQPSYTLSPISKNGRINSPNEKKTLVCEIRSSSGNNFDMFNNELNEVFDKTVECGDIDKFHMTFINGSKMLFKDIDYQKLTQTASKIGNSNLITGTSNVNGGLFDVVNFELMCWSNHRNILKSEHKTAWILPIPHENEADLILNNNMSGFIHKMHMNDDHPLYRFYYFLKKNYNRKIMCLDGDVDEIFVRCSQLSEYCYPLENHRNCIVDIETADLIDQHEYNYDDLIKSNEIYKLFMWYEFSYPKSPHIPGLIERNKQFEKERNQYSDDITQNN